MTNADKIEISNLIDTMEELNGYKNKLNERYVDEKVLAFATEAKKDYLDNKRYMLDVIHENLHLFFNLNEFVYNGSSFDVIHAGRGDKVTYRFSNGVHLLIRLTNATAIRSDTFNVRSMDVLDIHWRTSDTDDKRYKVCSSWDLVDSAHDEVVKKPFDEPKTAKEWDALYCRALWTRDRNVLLVNEFKNLLKSRVSAMREEANKTERIRNELKVIVGSYVKVDL